MATRGQSARMLLSIALRIGGQASVLVLFLVFARLLPLQDYGTLAFVLTWINLLTILGTAGTDTVLMRYVAQYKELSDWRSMIAVIRWAAIVVTSSSMVVLVIASVGWSLVASDEYFSVFLVCGLLVPIFAASAARQSIGLAFGNVTSALLPEGILRPVMAVLILAMVASSAGLDAATAGISYTVASALTLVIGLIWIGRLLRAELPSVTSAAGHSADWRRVALATLFVSIFVQFLAQTDILIVGMLMRPDDVGIYHAANRTSDAVRLGFTAIQLVAAPALAAAFAAKSKSSLQAALTHAVNLTTLVTVPLVLLLFVFAEELLGLFGPEFSDGSFALRVLLIGHTFNALTGAKGYALAMTGNHRLMAQIMGAVVVLNIPLTWILTAKFSTAGAAFATAAAAVACNASLSLAVWRRLGVKSWVSLRRA